MHVKNNTFSGTGADEFRTLPPLAFSTLACAAALATSWARVAATLRAIENKKKKEIKNKKIVFPPVSLFSSSSKASFYLS